MATFQSGPFNIEQGNSAYFTVEFLDVNGKLSVPSLATMTVSYTNTSAATQSDVLSLVPSGSFFNCTWSSTSASLGLATWVALTAASSVQLSTGLIRVIQRKGN